MPLQKNYRNQSASFLFVQPARGCLNGDRKIVRGSLAMENVASTTPSPVRTHGINQRVPPRFIRGRHRIRETGPTLCHALESECQRPALAPWRAGKISGGRMSRAVGNGLHYEKVN